MITHIADNLAQWPSGDPFTQMTAIHKEFRNVSGVESSNCWSTRQYWHRSRRPMQAPTGNYFLYLEFGRHAAETRYRLIQQHLILLDIPPQA